MAQMSQMGSMNQLDRSASKTHAFVITSPTTGEGKSVAASNLAIALAQSGQRTLLVDADFWRPVQHTIHGIDGGAGFSNVLAGDATLIDTVSPGGVEGLDILPAGPPPQHPTDLFTQRMLEPVMAEIMQAYDYVIFDAPPVLASVPDASILASQCNGVLMVLSR